MKTLSLAVIVSGVALASCSDGAPTAPRAPGVQPGIAAVGPPSNVAGVYDLSFAVLRNGVWESVTTLPVSSEELFLVAHVYEQGTGAPALAVSAIFEYCSYGGRPNNIENADEAPLSACQDGTADWRRLGSSRLDTNSCTGLGAGYTCEFFGAVRIPRSIGFRFQYGPQGGLIDEGASAEMEFTWTAQ